MTRPAEDLQQAGRHPGLRLSTYKVSADGRRHSFTPVTVTPPEIGPPDEPPRWDFWPDCACPRHRSGARDPRPRKTT